MQTREHPTGPSRPSTARGAAEAERERRLRVLHELALQAQPLERTMASSAVPTPTTAEREEPPQPETGPSLSPDRQALWRRAKRQRLVRGFGFLGLLALVVVALLGAQVVHPFARTTILPKSAGPLAISLTASGIGCPFDATWGPDNASIAVIGRLSCAQGTNTLALFDATSGKVKQKINLDAMVDPGVAQALGEPGVQNYVSFGPVLWSQVGRIAVPYTAVPIGANNSDYSLAGLVLTDQNVASIQPLTNLAPLETTPSYDLWDLNAGTLTINPDAIANTQPGNEYAFASLYPGLQYNWGFSGDLYVAQPLPDPFDPNTASSEEAVPVGSPTNGGPFSMWQFGSIIMQSSGSAAPLATWNSSFGAWSPDGSRIVEPLSLSAVLEPLGQSPLSEIALAGTPFANAPIIRVRDAAMQVILAQLEASSPGGSGGMALAWRPDGKALAAIADVGPTGSFPSNHEVTIYDCSNGKELAILAPPAAKSSEAQGGWPVRWSPSGKQLLLYDPLLNALVVWGPDMLPK